MIQCEGYRRYGGAFTLGPVRWAQCKEKAIVMLEVLQDGEVLKQPSCKKCWEESIEYGIKITNAEPI